MKIKLTILLMAAAGITYAQQDNFKERAQAYYDIIQSGSADAKDSLHRELLLTSKKSKDARELELCINFLRQLGQEESSDSLQAAVVKKFPKSKVARDYYIDNMYYKRENAEEKEKAYKALLKKWPAKEFPGDEISYDYVTANLASSMAEEGRSDDALKYLDQLRERFWRGNAYLPVAKILLSKGDTTRALPLFKTVVEDCLYYIKLPANEQTNKSKFAAMGYASSVSQLVTILVDQKKYDEALVQIEDAIKIAPEQSENLAYVYYKCLAATDRNLEAYHELSKLYREGDFGYEPAMRDLYVKLNGSDRGLDRYLADLQEQLVAKIRSHIQSLKQYKPAPDFELLNLKGERVSLKSLRGKVVVLDFWATWCQPCKRSFPGMKAAQTLYENDDEVVFLFVNTWERDKNYKENVAAFIKNNNYPFNVVFDDVKDPITKAVLATKFGVKGIPAKFIIDKDGYIRYALLGSSPMENYIKIEMKELIESAKKPHEVENLASGG